MLSGTELFSVTSQSVVGAQERADAMNEAILDVAKSRRRGPEDLHLVQDNRIQATLLMCDNMLLGAVWNYEAEAVGSTPEAIASERLEIIRQAIIDYRNDFSVRSLIKSAIYAVIVTIVFVVILVAIAPDTIVAAVAAKTT